MGNPFDQFDISDPDSNSVSQPSDSVQNSAQDGANNTNGQQPSLPNNLKGQQAQGANPFDQFDIPVVSHNKPSTSDASTSFVKNPSWKNFGNAAVNAAGDVTHGIIQDISDKGDMAAHPSRIDTPGKALNMVLPFLGAGAAEGEGPLMSAGANARNATGAIPTGPQLRDISGRMFDLAKEKGAVFTPEASQGAATSVENAVTQSGKLNDRLHGDTLSVLNDMKDDASNRNLDLEDMQQYRQLFGDVVNKNLYPNGKMMPDAMKASRAQDAISSFLSNAGPEHIINGSTEGVDALNQARPLWAASARMDDIQNIMDRAELRENPATSMRAGFAALASNGRRMRGFTDDQQDLIRQAAQTNMPMEFLRSAGSRLLNIAGLAHGPVAGTMSQLGTYGARNAAAYMQAQRGQEVLNNIGKSVDLPNMTPKETPLQLEGPPIRSPSGGFAQQPPAAPMPDVNYNPGQKQLNAPYDPHIASRALGYQPSADFEVTPEGWASQPATTKIRQNTSTAEQLKNAKIQTDKNVSKAPFKQLTYQPRPDFIGTDNGIVQATPNEQAGEFGLGTAQGMPIGTPGELQSIRGNPRYPHKRGGTVQKPRTGVIFAKPKSYPALRSR